MDSNDPARPNTDDLQFEEAEFTGKEGDASSCEICLTSFDDVYYEVNGRAACERCRRQMEADRTRGTGASRFMRASFFGFIGGAIGAGIYYAVLAITGYEIGLVAIVVGFLVGAAVRIGSGGGGGRVYQLLAATLTYVAIVSTYVPFIIEALSEAVEEEQLATTDGEESSSSEETQPTEESGTDEASDDPQLATTLPGEEELTGAAFVLAAIVAIIIFALLVLASPFLAGFENIIGWLIIGFAVYQAWRMNVYEPLVIEGPLKISTKEAPNLTAGPGPSFGSADP